MFTEYGKSSVMKPDQYVTAVHRQGEHAMATASGNLPHLMVVLESIN
jgi:hypothetical protein